MANKLSDKGVNTIQQKIFSTRGLGMRYQVHTIIIIKNKLEHISRYVYPVTDIERKPKRDHWSDIDPGIDHRCTREGMQ